MIERFRADLDRLVAPKARIGIAVSGGPDSIALLLLAAAVRPLAVASATVDHGLRANSASEAALVAGICNKIGIPHVSLPIHWQTTPTSNLQAIARERRYAELARWAHDCGLAAIATAHHADDQAETMLMRIARGAGIAGLGGVRPVRSLDGSVDLIRPLLEWGRADLRQIVDDAGIEPVDDPSNRDDRFDRTAARDLLAAVDWLDPARLAAAASHCRDADEALAWAAARELETRIERMGGALLVRAAGLPRELRRRLLVAAMLELGSREPPGPDLASALHRLEAGQVTTLAGLKLEGGSTWRLSVAPARNATAGPKST